MPFGKATWFIPTLTWQPRRLAERVVVQFPGKAIIAAAWGLFWPFKYLDAVLIKKLSAHHLAFRVYGTAREAAAPT